MAPSTPPPPSRDVSVSYTHLDVYKRQGRFLGLDSEQALTRACDKFIRRFRTVEELAPCALKECSLEELEALWAQAKSHPEAQA